MVEIIELIIFIDVAQKLKFILFWIHYFVLHSRQIFLKFITTDSLFKTLDLYPIF